MKGIIKSTLILTSIAVVSGFLLGFVNDITKDIITERNGDLKVESLSAVTEGGEIDMNNSIVEKEITGNENVIIEEAYDVIGSDGSVKGVVMIINTSAGYNGTIRFSLGISNSLKVTGIDFLEINETPGLGMRVKENEYISQFYSKTVEDISETYDAISGATVSSDAVYDAVIQGLHFYDSYNKEVSVK